MNTYPVMNRCKYCNAEFETYECYWKNNATGGNDFLQLHTDMCQQCHRKKIGSNLSPWSAI